MFTKESLEYLRESAEVKIHDINGRKFYNDSKGNMIEVKLPTIPCDSRIVINTLDGVVDWAKDKGAIDYIKVTPESVIVWSPLNDDLNRDIPLVSKDDSDFRAGEYMNQSDFIVYLMTKFIMNEDLDYLIKLVSVFSEEESKTLHDNGISQKITVKIGTRAENTVIKNIVKLKPYRTYSEVDQPESDFLFRVNRGMSFALFETDNGRWRHEACRRIKEYLQKDLPDIMILF